MSVITDLQVNTIAKLPLGDFRRLGPTNVVRQCKCATVTVRGRPEFLVLDTETFAKLDVEQIAKLQKQCKEELSASNIDFAVAAS